MNCIQHPLSKFFASVGRFIGRHPWYFVTIPFILSVILSTGVMRIDVRKQVEYLYAPTNSKYLENKQKVTELFPMNTSEYFDLGRVPDAAMFTVLIIVAKDGKSILRGEIMDEIMEIDSAIRDLKVEIDGSSMTYADVCAKKREQCLKNEAKDLTEKIHKYEQRKGRSQGEKKLDIQYPIYINEAAFEFISYGVFLGGVEQDYEGNAESAEAIRLFYYMDDSDKNRFDRATKWETAVSNMLETFQSRNITYTWFSKTSYAIETSKVTRKMSLFLVISLVVMIVLVFAASMSRQWTQSKPWMSVAFLLCIILSMASGLGLGMYCGIKFATIIIFDLFLLLGIGMNDTFVLISNWRRSDRKETVDNRLAEAYSATFVPVTATYLIILVSFCVGLTIPFRAAQIFCAYSALTSTFLYLYEITFLGGCLAIGGYREINDRHPLTCVAVSGRPKKGVRKFCDEDPSKPEVNYLLSFAFGRSYVALLTNIFSRCTFLAIFLAYIILAALQCTKLQIASGAVDMFPKDSHLVSYFDSHYKYFTMYPHRVQLVVDAQLDYSDPIVQQQVENLLESFENSTFIEKKLTGCWLRIYKGYREKAPSFLIGGLSFLEALQLSFLSLRQTIDISTDIIFSEDGSSIETMRCAVQTYNISDAEKEKDLLDELERIASRSEIPLVFSSISFPSYDLHRIIRSIVLWMIPIAAGVALTSFTLLVPNIIGILGATFSTVSVQVGVIGFLALWDVKVNSFFAVMMVMIIGLSANYACHLTYAYVMSKEEARIDRTLFALRYYGPVVAQTTLVLIIACAFLMLVGNLLLEIFYKIIFLVFVFGALHGLAFLPALYFTLDGFARFSRRFRPEAHEMGKVPTSELIGTKGGTSI